MAALLRCLAMRQGRALEGEMGTAIDDAIEVMAFDRGKPGVKRGTRLLGRDDRNRMRTKMRIEGVAHGVLVPILRQIHMADLTERVHTGVGAPGALYADLLAAEALGCRRQQSLHGRSIVLNLPADEWPAVIFDNKLVARHGATYPNRTPGGTGLPRRNSRAFMAWRPARCNSRIR